MLRPLIQRSRRSAAHRTRERGVTMALVALSMVAIISMAALSIDIGTLYQASAEAQRAADAGALAGARMIAISGLTTDPTNGASGGTVSWAEICGGPGSPASLAAIAIGQQNVVGGTSPTVAVTYSAGSGSSGAGSNDCTAAGASFGINPVVTVKVQQPSLVTFFAHVFSLFNANWKTASVSATASAEAFNSSDAGSYAVQPRCVKPWIVPNLDPYLVGCTTGCAPFVNTATGAINRPGIFADGSGIVGEQLWLVADCDPTNSGLCKLLSSPPQANYPTPNGVVPPPPGTYNLEYVPGQAPISASASTAIPACSGTTLSNTYAQAIAGCDQATQYQCGIPGGNNVDLTENPVYTPTSDTTNGAQCLIHQTPTTTGLLNGQDSLLAAGGGTYPFQIQAGFNNPIVSAPGGLTANTLITSSTSIVSIPIYDQNATVITQGGPAAVTIVGFLQVFINQVDNSGNVQVTVMNVTGCGPAPVTTYNGTSSVPVRLITPP